MATRLGRDKGGICWAAEQRQPRQQQYQAGSNKQYLDWKCWIPNNDAAQLFNSIEPAKRRVGVGAGDDCEYCRYSSSTIIFTMSSPLFARMPDPDIIKYEPSTSNQRWWPEMPLKNCSIYTYVWKLKWIFWRAIFCVKYSMKYSLGSVGKYSSSYNPRLYPVRLWDWIKKWWWPLPSESVGGVDSISGGWWHPQQWLVLSENLFWDPGLHLAQLR